MPWSVLKHCPNAHPLYHGARCPLCAAAGRARHDLARPSSSARGYGGAWAKARSSFLASHNSCKSCGKPATVVDHIKPHKGDSALFWSKDNWQPLCTPCHNRKTATQDGGFGRPSVAGGANNLDAAASGPVGKKQTQYRENWGFWS